MIKTFMTWLSEDEARVMSKVDTMKYYFPYIQKIPNNVDRIRAQHFLTNADFKNLLGLLNKYGINVVSTKPTGQSFTPPTVSEPMTNISGNPFGTH
jgi:hypothetical protein